MKNFDVHSKIMFMGKHPFYTIPMTLQLPMKIKGTEEITCKIPNIPVTGRYTYYYLFVFVT